MNPRRFAYCIITDRCLYDQPLESVAQAAEEAGMTYFQLREKDLSSPELLQLAQKLRSHLHATQFVINGSLDIAIAVQADGVHLQRNNLPTSLVRSKFPQLTIGYSAHSVAEALQAEAEGATYVFLSPVFSPRSKTGTSSPVGLQTLQQCTRALRIPVYALGGISSENLPAVESTGCAGAAGISLFIKSGYFTTSELVL